MLVDDVPPGYLPIRSGVGATPPRAVVVLPVLFEGRTLGVIEFGAVTRFSELHLTFLERLVVTIGVAIRTIQANRRTEELLAQSQRLAGELQDQSAELQRTNAELEEKAAQLSEQNRNIEIKNMEIDAARRGVEEKAQQLAAASQYKSEFLANMSHELRTPLNSLLLLSRLLADNPDANLSPRQIEFASTIHSAGSDLLRADRRHPRPVQDRGGPGGRRARRGRPRRGARLRRAGVRRRRPRTRASSCASRPRPELPAEIVTDAQRLQQILRNLLSNAMKFTAHGSVALVMGPAPRGAAGRPADGRPHGRLHRARHRHRHRGRQAGDDLRGVPAGRRHHQPQVRRHRPGPVDQPGAGPAARRGHHRVVAARRGLGVHPVPARHPAAPARRCAPATRRAGELGPAERPTPMIVAVPEPRHGTRPVPALRGRTVLIVDDDVRNVFALTSALELHGLRVLYSDNGADGIATAAPSTPRSTSC